MFQEYYRSRRVDYTTSDDITIQRRYFNFVPREYTFTFTPGTVTFNPAVSYDGMDTEGFDDLYPCGESELSDIEELL